MCTTALNSGGKGWSLFGGSHQGHVALPHDVVDVRETDDELVQYSVRLLITVYLSDQDAWQGGMCSCLPYLCTRLVEPTEPTAVDPVPQSSLAGSRSIRAHTQGTTVNDSRPVCD
jgi:hypothetical protein